MIRSHVTLRQTVVGLVALLVAVAFLGSVATPAAAQPVAGGFSAPVSGDGIGGSMEIRTQNADGSVTIDTFYKGGAKKRETRQPDGSSTTTTTSADGKTSVTVTTDANGNVTSVTKP